MLITPGFLMGAYNMSWCSWYGMVYSLRSQYSWGETFWLFISSEHCWSLGCTYFGTFFLWRKSLWLKFINCMVRSYVSFWSFLCLRYENMPYSKYFISCLCLFYFILIFLGLSWLGHMQPAYCPNQVNLLSSNILLGRINRRSRYKAI